MFKMSSLFLGIMVLMQSINLGLADLVQLDELIEHAQYHKAQYGDDFLTFLSKHYGEQKEDHNQKHQEEHQDHEQLPFQQTVQIMAVTQNIFKEDVLPKKIEGLNNSSSFFHQDNFKAHLFILGVFQPPRTV